MASMIAVGPLGFLLMHLFQHWAHLATAIGCSRYSVMPKGVDSLELSAIAVSGDSNGPGSVPQGWSRQTYPYWYGERCVLLGYSDLVNSAKAVAYQLPRATD